MSDHAPLIAAARRQADAITAPPLREQEVAHAAELLRDLASALEAPSDSRSDGA